MTETAEKLKTDLAALPADDRAELAYFLLRSLDEEADPDAEAVLDDVLRRRAEEIRSGKVVGAPLEEVLQELRERYP